MDLGTDYLNPDEALKQAALAWRPGQPAIAPYQAQGAAAGLNLPPVGGKLGAPPAEPQAMPAGNPVQLPSSPQPKVIAPRGTIQGDEAERTRLLDTGSGISQISSKIQNSGFGQNHPLLSKILGGAAQGVATLGDVGLSTLLPAAAINLPGTQYHHQALVNHASGAVAQDEANAEKEAQTAQATANAGHLNAETPEIAPNALSTRNYQGAQTRHLNDESEDLENPQPTYSIHDTEDGPLFVNNETGTAQHLSVDGVPVGPKLKLTQSQPIMGPDNKPHTYMIDEKGNKVADLGVHYERPQVTNNFENREGDKGRALLDKAEAAYRQAQQGANGMKAMIDDALSGGKMSARMLPLEGALEITTANGVHRINRTEVDQYAGGGNAFDRLAGLLQGTTSGVPFTPEILKSMKHLTDIQERGAYDTYKGAFDSATKRYGLKDEQPLNGPAPETREYNGHTYEKGADGQWHLQQKPQ